MSQREELVDIVNKNNKIIGKTKREKVHQNKLYHRAANMMIFNSQGELFMQRRAKERKSYPLYWDLSASEHVKIGENYEQAARRGLKEELGIAVPVMKIRQAHFQDNSYRSKDEIIYDWEFIETYKALYDGEMTLDKEEVEEGRFMSFDEIDRLIKQDKIQFTPWFLDEWKFIQKDPTIISEE